MTEAGGPPQPGWWLASDGQWYPPELHPSAAMAPAQAQAPTAAPPGPGFPPAGSGFEATGMPGMPGANGLPPAGSGPPIYGQSATFGSPPSSAGSDKFTRKNIILLVGGAVVLVILLVVAIPTLFGTTNNPDHLPGLGASNSSGEDRAAQGTLISTIAGAQMAYESHNQSFTGLTLGELTMPFTAVGPTTPATTPQTISVAAVDHAVLMTDRSEDGLCWYILWVGQPTAQEAAQLPHAFGEYRASSHDSACEAANFPTNWSTAPGFPTP